MASADTLLTDHSWFLSAIPCDTLVIRLTYLHALNVQHIITVVISNTQLIFTFIKNKN